MPTIVDLIQKTEAFFRSRNIASPRLDAELLISHALSMQRMQLYMQFDKPLSTSEVDAIRILVRRRGQREPVAYIVQQKGFYNDDFFVQPGVLCPRPDTETLVETAQLVQVLMIGEHGSGIAMFTQHLSQGRQSIRHPTASGGTTMSCWNHSRHH